MVVCSILFIDPTWMDSREEMPSEKTLSLKDVICHSQDPKV